ncbi:hypothetical protein JCM11641_007188 [Rhodosporidiobolus odoratus]
MAPPPTISDVTERITAMVYANIKMPSFPSSMDRLKHSSKAQLFETYQAKIVEALHARPDELVALSKRSITREIVQVCLQGVNAILELGWNIRLPPLAVANIVLRPFKLVPLLAAHGELSAFRPSGNVINAAMHREVARSPQLAAQYAAFNELCGTSLGQEQLLRIPQFMHHLTTSLAVAIWGLEDSSAADTSSIDLSRANELFKSLRRPYKQASEASKHACIVRLRSAQQLVLRVPAMRDRPDFWSPKMYLKALGVEEAEQPKPEAEASLSKPQIGRRAASMYFRGGTKEGWEKAMRRRM